MPESVQISEPRDEVRQHALHFERVFLSTPVLFIGNQADIAGE